MADVRPFRGLRPRKDLAEQIASFPYDVINSKEAREIAKDNPISFLHVVKPEIDLPEGTNLYSDEVYQMGADNLQRLIKSGYMNKDEGDYYYFYRQIMGEHSQVGIVASASVDDYNNDIIKKHEHTRKVKEDDRTRHVDTLNANTGPVFLTYKHTEELDNVTIQVTSTEPIVDFKSVDGVQHTMWIAKDAETIEKIRNAFSGIDFLYVADGHHRSASGSRVQKIRMEKNSNHTGNEEYNFFLSVIFPDNQMKILDYNRIVKDLNGNTAEALIAKIEEKFDVEEIGADIFKPAKQNEYGMYLNKKWFKLTAKEGSFDPADPVNGLDVAILQNNLLSPILGIGDPRTDNRIDFVGGIRGLGELVKRVDGGEGEIAFAMFPTTIEQLMAIADAGMVMPPKSTWFEPKLRSGMIVHMLD